MTPVIPYTSAHIQSPVLHSPPPAEPPVRWFRKLLSGPNGVHFRFRLLFRQHHPMCAAGLSKHRRPSSVPADFYLPHSSEYSFLTLSI